MDIPARLQAVSKSLDLGDFKLALQQLVRAYDDRCGVDRVIKAEILLRAGDINRAHALILGALDIRSVPLEVKARALEHLGYITRHRGDSKEGIRLWEQSIHMANKAGDLEQCSRSQLHLLAAKADAYGPDALGTLPSEVRFNVLRTGNPYLWLMLHWRFAEVEARRSSFHQAERHLKIALALLAKYPSLWLEARLHLLYGVVADGLSRPDCAAVHSSRALEVARKSGCVFVETAALANLGDLHIATGKVDMARKALRDAQACARDWSVLRFGILHTLARLELVEGNEDACERLLSASTPQAGMPYIQIEGALTRIGLLRRRGNLLGALAMADSAAGTAAARSALALSQKALLLKTDILLDLERNEEAQTTLRTIYSTCNEESLGLRGELERLQGRLSLLTGARARASRRFERAARIVGFLGDDISQSELSRQADAAATDPVTPENGMPDMRGIVRHEPLDLSELLSSAVNVIDFGSHPQLLGGELLAMLKNTTGLIRRAAVCEVRGTGRRVDRHLNWLTAFGGEANGGARTVTIDLGAV